MDTSRSMTRIPALAVGSLAALAALPAAAHAAPTWVKAPGACYVSVGPTPVQREVVPFIATGLKPNAQLAVLVDGVPPDIGDDGQPDTFFADPSGTLAITARAPYQATGQRPFTVMLA